MFCIDFKRVYDKQNFLIWQISVNSVYHIAICPCCVDHCTCLCQRICYTISLVLFISVNGESIRLTQVEYRIVELLARNPGKVLTYGYIINNIWGPYADADNNRILRVNMSHIRKKLEPDSMKPQYILTEIGVGYRMAE